MCRRRNNGANSATGKMKMKLKLKLESRTWLSVLWSQFRWQRGVCAICDKLPFVGTFFWHCFKVRQKPEMRTWPTFCIKCLLKSCLPLLFNLPAPDSGFWPDFKWPRYLMEMIDSHPYRSGMRPKFSANSNSGLSWLGSGQVNLAETKCKSQAKVSAYGLAAGNWAELQRSTFTIRLLLQ